jgi:hypothetical protein
MDLTRHLRMLTRFVAGASAVLTGLTFAMAGPWAGFGALVGGIFATANFVLMGWFGKQLVKASDTGRAILGSLLAVKLLVVLLAVWGILSTGWVDPFGFTVGISGLFAGLVAGAFLVALKDVPEDHGAGYGDLGGDEGS